MTSVALAVLALALPGRATAQPCCAGASALAPARLAPHEDALVGLQVKGTDVLGSFDGKRRFIGAPRGTYELDLEEDLLGAIRVLSRGQVSASIPLVETWRRVPSVSEAGIGLGDLQLGARWDFTLPGASMTIPGIALSAAVVFPTGRPPESASQPLATDAGGAGAFQGSFSLAVEQTFGSFLTNLTGALTLRAPRTVGDVTERQGVQFVAFAAGGYAFKHGASIALTAAYTAELDAAINGVIVPDSGRAFTRAGVAGAYSFLNGWRAQGTVFGDLPIPSFGHNQPIGVGLTFTLIRSWS